MILDAFEKISKINCKVHCSCITALELHVAGCHVARELQHFLCNARAIQNHRQLAIIFNSCAVRPQCQTLF